MEVYNVEELSLGDKEIGDKIIFTSFRDMELAYKEIDNGRNIYVKTEDGLITKILNQMVTSKIYEGSIKLSARPQAGEEIKEFIEQRYKIIPI